MRTTLKTLPSSIREYGLDGLTGWWIDLPRRWRHRWFWKSLFFEPGQGLLRWKMDRRDSYGGWMDPPEAYPVAPPLRRLYMTIRFRAKWPLEMKDEDWLS